MAVVESAGLRQRLGQIVNEEFEIVHTLARSGDPASVEAILDLLDNSAVFGPRIRAAAVEGLVDTLPAGVEVVLSRLARAPLSDAGGQCAYMLGELAYKQGEQRDVRIVPALLTALDIALRDGTGAAMPFVNGLRECVRGGGMAEITPRFLAVLLQARSERYPEVGTILGALEALLDNEGEAIFAELQKLREGRAEDDLFAGTVNEFLRDHLAQASKA
jgi:hypothetical protein